MQFLTYEARHAQASGAQLLRSSLPARPSQSLLALNSVTEWLQGVPVLNALVTAILPGLVLKLFLTLLPSLLALGAISVVLVALAIRGVRRLTV